MRCFQPPAEVRFYAGVDLHARFLFLVVLDHDGRTRLSRNLTAAPEPFLQAVQPFRDGLVVGRECMHCWYWLADACRDHDLPFALGHAWAMKAVHGSKTKCDRHDAEAIARLLRGGNFPLAYAYPKERRGLRDLLRARELVETLRPRVEPLLQDTACQLAAHADARFGANEFALRDLLLQAGADLPEASLRKKKRLRRRRGDVRHCPHPAPFHSHRPKTFVGLLGSVTLRRAYYRRGRCGRGRFPFDERSCLSWRGLTLAAEEVVSLTGLLTEGFAEAAEKILPRLAGPRLGESTVERATEDVGGVPGDRLDQGGTLGDKTCWAWRPDARGRRVAYVSLDATGVPRQGPGGAAVEGRMPLVAMVYNPPAHEAGADAAGCSAKAKAASRMQARYLAGLYTLPLLGLLLRRQARQVGTEEADLWVGLSDAGNGLEDFVRQNFNRPDLVIVPDFYHPAGAVGGVGQVLARRGRGQGPGAGGPMVRAVEAARGRETAGTPAGLAAGTEGGEGEISGDAGIPGEPPTQDGLPGLSAARAVHRLGPGGERLRDGGGAATEAGGDALGGGRHGPRLSPAGPVHE